MSAIHLDLHQLSWLPKCHIKAQKERDGKYAQHRDARDANQAFSVSRRRRILRTASASGTWLPGSTKLLRKFSYVELAMELSERTVDVRTRDGAMETFFVCRSTVVVLLSRHRAVGHAEKRIRQVVLQVHPKTDMYKGDRYVHGAELEGCDDVW